MWGQLHPLTGFTPVALVPQPGAEHTIVPAALLSQMGMPAQYVLGTSDQVKIAFAGEVDGLTTVAPTNLMSSRK